MTRWTAIVNYERQNASASWPMNHSKEDKTGRFGGEIKASDKIDAGVGCRSHLSVTGHDVHHNPPETPEAWPTAAFRPLILLVHGCSRPSRRHVLNTAHNPLRTMLDTYCSLCDNHDTKMNTFSQTQRSTGRLICTISKTIFGVNGITR